MIDNYNEFQLNYFSTLSSGLNSLAAVIWEDVFVAFGIANNDVNNAERISYGIRPITSSSSYGTHDHAENTLLQKRQLVITRSIATLMGVISIGFAVLASSLDGILQLANSVMASLAGPLLATFVLGFFTTTTNKIVSKPTDVVLANQINYTNVNFEIPIYKIFKVFLIHT